MHLRALFILIESRYESIQVRVPTFLELSELPALATSCVPNEWIDFMGHMNVVWYTHLFGRSVLEFFDTIGLTHEYFSEQNAGSFIVEQHFRYIAEVRVGETVSVRTRAIGRSDKRLHFLVFLIKEDTKLLAATSEVITVHIDMSSRRSSLLPTSIARSFDSVVAQHAMLTWDPPVNGFTQA